VNVAELMLRHPTESRRDDLRDLPAVAGGEDDDVAGPLAKHIRSKSGPA